MYFRLIHTLILFQVCLVLSLPGRADIRSLVIIHTNDFHGHVRQQDNYAGAARIGSLIKFLKSERDDVLAVDAGDAVSGTPISTLFQGTPIYEIMSKMKYDLGNLGNHEFDYGYQQIRRFRKAASFPILSANAVGPDGKLLADRAWKIIKVNDIRVGVIGVITTTTPSIITPQGNRGIAFNPVVSSVTAAIEQMKGRTDLIILLSHLGIEEDRKLARVVDDLDLIIGGHSHTHLWPAVRENKTWIVQADRYGTFTGKIELTVDTKTDRIEAFHSTLIPAADMPPEDQELKRKVQYWVEKLSRELDKEIIYSRNTIADEQLRSWIENVMTLSSDADFGYYNMGGIRDNIPEGKITARHIWNIEPFGNTLVTMKLNGRQLKQLLLREGEDRPDFQQLKDEQVFNVATNNFAAAHAKKTFPDIQVFEKDVLIRDILISHIQRQGLPDSTPN